MPWGTEFPTRVRTHRTAWSAELAALPGPPHREVWTSPGAQANAPALTATAQLLTPAVKSGAVANLPASGESFPHQFPWQFSGPGATLSAKAELLTPSVGVGPVPAAAPALAASAELLAPTVNVTTEDVIVEVPLLTASAEMPTADLVAVVEVPLLTASAATNGFPYQFPRSFAPNGFLVPDLVAEASLPTAEASADLLSPTVSLGYSPVPPIVTAAAEVLSPTVTAGAAASVPMATASASLLPPTVVWDQPPIGPTPYTANATVDVAALRASGYTHLVLVGVGGAEAGTSGTFITGQGGNAGSWNNAIIELAAYPLLTTINIVRGNGGSSSGGDGTATTFTGNSGSGMPTLTCAGGSGNTGILAGGNAGNVTVDGDPYTGGTGSASAGGAGSEPGGGGAGGNFFGAGGAGAPGRAWVKAKRVN